MLKLTEYIIFGWESTIGVLKIPIAIVMVVFEIPIVNKSDSIGHPWMELICKFGMSHFGIISYGILQLQYYRACSTQIFMLDHAVHRSSCWILRSKYVMETIFSLACVPGMKNIWFSNHKTMKFAFRFWFYLIAFQMIWVWEWGKIKENHWY